MIPWQRLDQILIQRCHVDLKRLEYFLLVADHGSFSRVSSVIGVAQPALGRQIQHLEDDCGVRLFYRHGRGVTLTPEGELFAERVRPLLKQLAEAISDLGTSDRPLSGSITIGLTPSMASLIAFPLLQKLQAVAPGIRLNFLTGNSGNVHEWMVDGRLDIAILHDARRSRHIAVELIATEQLLLVSHPQLLAAAGLAAHDSVSLAELDGLPMALPSSLHGLRRTLDRGMGDAKCSLNVQYELDTLTLIKEVVLARIAHTVLAMPTVSDEVRQGKLQARPLDPGLQTRLMITTSLNRPLTREGRAVLGQIRPVLRDAVRQSPVPLHLEVH